MKITRMTVTEAIIFAQWLEKVSMSPLLRNRIELALETKQLPLPSLPTFIVEEYERRNGRKFDPYAARELGLLLIHAMLVEVGALDPRVRNEHEVFRAWWEKAPILEEIVSMAMRVHAGWTEDA